MMIFSISEVEAVPQRPRKIYFGQMPRASVNADKEVPAEGFRGCMHAFQVSEGLGKVLLKCVQGLDDNFIQRSVREFLSQGYFHKIT